MNIPKLNQDFNQKGQILLSKR